MSTPERDREGYLKHLEDWTPEVANTLASGLGIELTEAHWRVIHIVRAFHAKTEVAPAMRPLVKIVKTELGPEHGNSIALHLLFPGSPAKVIAKIAGLPRPTNCL
jgi:tRNA 2-thiouridine synthesizing protein E